MSKIENQNTETNNQESSWFASWFDTPYYHILYQNRNDEEAHQFMDNLTEYLNMPENGTILDLACGKGRHAVYLNQLGYNVLGVDLSENSIDFAKKSENDKLHFEVHDMRQPIGKQFDAVFNLFTSFGYFDSDEDNYKTICAIKESINEYGFGVIDFMNVPYILEHLVAHETKTLDGIDFKIHRYEKDGYICKDISFDADGKSHHYTEKVRALQLEDFVQMIENSGMFLLDIFGDYKLHKYYRNQSERLILIFK